jgi:probable HAF family extracellular repeat protein
MRLDRPYQMFHLCPHGRNPRRGAPMVSVKLLISHCLFGFTLAVFLRPAIAEDYKFITLNDPNASETYGYGINNAGQIVGYAQHSASVDGFIYTNGSYVNLSAPIPDSETLLFDINNSGEIVGDVYQSGPSFPYAFTYSEGSYMYFNVFGKTFTVANGLNDKGDIVGYYYTGTKFNGFVGQDGVYDNLSFPAASDTWANGINNLDQVVGYYQDSQGNNRGFLYSGGVYYKIDVPNSIDTLADGINDKGQIVGYYLDANDPGQVQSFVYSNGIYTEIVPQNSYLSAAFGINDAGDIVGYYDDYAGSLGYLAIPVPVPVPEFSTWAMLLIGFASLGMRARALRVGLLGRNDLGQPHLLHGEKKSFTYRRPF